MKHECTENNLIHRHIVLGCIAVTLSIYVSTAAAEFYIDDTNIVWEINFDLCPDTLGLCTSTGWRDINNDLGCGPMPVYGTAVANTLSVTTFGNSTPDCETTHWRGNLPNDSTPIIGHWQNQNGQTGPFELQVTVNP